MESEKIYYAVKFNLYLYEIVYGFCRNEQKASLVVDNGHEVIVESPGQLRQLNTDTGLFIGNLS